MEPTRLNWNSSNKDVSGYIFSGTGLAKFREYNGVREKSLLLCGFVDPADPSYKR